MQGMFQANGGCGYVKKPDILLKDGLNNEVFDPKRKLQVKQTLKVGENFQEKTSSPLFCCFYLKNLPQLSRPMSFNLQQFFRLRYSWEKAGI